MLQDSYKAAYEYRKKMMAANRRTEKMGIRTGVIGSGAISDIYLTNMINRFENLDVVAIASKHTENAQKKAEQYNIPW